MKAEAISDCAEQYKRLLMEHARFTASLRHYLAKIEHGSAKWVEKFQDTIESLDRDRHAVHLELLACATKLGKDQAGVFADLLLHEGGNVADEYGLPGAIIISLPIQGAIAWRNDSGKLVFKSLGWREHADAESELTNHHSLENPHGFSLDPQAASTKLFSKYGTFPHWQESQHVLLVYQAGVGCNSLFPQSEVLFGHNLRISRCVAAAKALSLHLCYADTSSSYHGNNWIFGLEIPVDRFESIVGAIRNKLDEWWIQEKDIDPIRKFYKSCWDQKICPQCSSRLKTSHYSNGTNYTECVTCHSIVNEKCAAVSSRIGGNIVESWK